MREPPSVVASRIAILFTNFLLLATTVARGLGARLCKNAQSMFRYKAAD
jgi:hypothetical protein